MSIRRRKKAIQKVVKLLNLATSSNASESTMALRHAESLIRQYTIAQRELPILQLCDRAMLYRVSWGSSAPLYAKDPLVKPSVQNSVYQRRFSEKNTDPNRAYESVRTILDDIAFDEVMNVDRKQAQDEQPLESEHDVNGEQAQNESGAGPKHNLDAEHDDENSADNRENDNMLKDDVTPVMEEDVTPVMEEEVMLKDKSQSDGVFTSYNNDNVIDAAQAFRPSVHEFAETLKTQYATSNPDVPFADDEYWSKVYEKLADFDEAKIQAEIEALNQQLSLAQENLHLKKQKRYEQEQEEIQERSERARIEQSFEEAIERAFQARARAYEAWEERCSQVRMSCLRDEQEAVQGYESINLSLEKYQESFKQHIQRKEDYRAAKIMHELRRHLALAVSVNEEATGSYEKVIEIMADNGLSLKDLEFSDIKNKSLFIRLLERESALISDVHERERHTEEMLDKFLTSSLSKKETKASENPLQHIQRLLNAANEGGQFETQKNLEQVIHLMGSNDIGVRDIGYDYIKKYSVFIRLINWEAEQIAFLPDREKFTTQILEEYIQHSVQKPKANSDQKMSR